MDLSGALLIGSENVNGKNGETRGFDPSNGERLDPVFGGASLADVDRACGLAAEAFDGYRAVSLERRAQFLETIAEKIAGIGDVLIERCMAETGLPRARLEGERARTIGQLRLFAGVVRDGGFLDVRIDPAQPDRTPIPRVDLRLRNIPLGPVAVFGASNFPLAFSVAGGDTASAFAAGCPVIVKAHPAHPGTSELVGQAVRAAVVECNLPEGTFSLLFTTGNDVAQALVADRRVAAVGFTGSRAGGTALMRTAANRPVPIPVYAEMSSVNPVVLMPYALAERGDAIGRAFVQSLTLGAGQFCTNPGLILAIESNDLDRFIVSASAAIIDVRASTMLTPGIHEAYVAGSKVLADHPAVNCVGAGAQGRGYQGQAALFVTDAQSFIQDDTLQAEVFGASALVVRCRDMVQLQGLLEHLEGQLTAAVHMHERDTDAVRRLMPVLERRAGRILINGFGTGVEVAHAMVHGGPFPATSDGRSTSVGSLAIQRFVRPVCYQDMPGALLPDEVQDTNSHKLWRRIDGVLTRP